MKNITEQEIMKHWKGDISHPLVSICTITYNHEKYIAEALDSFLMQETNFPFEILIDDDCSPDGTAEVIKKYMEKFPNIIRATLREKNIGMIENSRENRRRAKGEYIAFCEGDDYWIDKQKLQYQIEKMKKHSNCEMSFHPAISLKQDTMMERMERRHAKHDKVFNLKEIIKGDGGFCPSPSIIVKREAIDRLPKFYGNAPAGDYILQIFGSMKAGALYIDKAMSVYRVHSGGLYTATENNFLLRKNFLVGMMEQLNEIDKFFNFQYQKEIMFVRSNMLIYALDNKNYSIHDRIDLYEMYKHYLSEKQQIQWLEKIKTEKNHLVSIIIPCYNQVQYLKESVQSTVDQTYPNIEVIIVNDGSSDNTQEVAIVLQKKHPHIIRVITQKNQGLSQARNAGIKESIGKYILPLDADDILDKKMISYCMNAMMKYNTDIVHGALQCFGQRDNVWISKPFSENNILYQNLPHQSSLFKKEVWIKNNGYKQNMHGGYEDWEFWINAYKHNFTFHYLPKILYYYRIKEESMYTESFKKDAYLKAKIVMNHPELYMVNWVQEAIATIKETEKLADLYFYYDENIAYDEKTLLTKIAHEIKNNKLEDKQVLKIFDTKIGLCNMNILTTHMPIQELYDEMDISFILFFSPIRYEVTTLQNSAFAWDKDKGIINAQGTLFPFVFKSEREKPELQRIAHKRLLKYRTKLSPNQLLHKNDKIMVSICVLSYNQDKYIIEALNSILMQKVNFRYNIVIGEDCSTDKTRQILQDYVRKYPDQFILLLHDKNLGMLANFAKTLKSCNGKYIALLDGDDYWTDPFKLQKQVDFLESNKEYSMVFHNIELHDQVRNDVIVKPFNPEDKSRDYTYEEILETWSVGTCSVLCINNEQFSYIENNLWFPVQDLPFYLSCASAGKVYYLAETMCVYRRMQTGMTRTKFSDKGIEMNFIWIRYYQSLYKDFKHLLSEDVINHKYAIQYLGAARKSRKVNHEEGYSQYLRLALSFDLDFVYNEEIAKQKYSLTTKQIDTIRDSAVLLEKENIKLAHDLMEIAHKERPNGPFIEKKLNEYKSIIKGNNCESEKND